MSRSLGEHVVEPTETDVVGPAVSANDPDTALEQIVAQRERSFGAGAIDLSVVIAARRAAHAVHPLRTAGLFASSMSSQAPHRLPARALRASCCVLAEFVERYAQAVAEFRVVLEERVRPGGTAAAAVGRPGRRGQVAAEDRRAARRVGDNGWSPKSCVSSFR